MENKEQQQERYYFCYSYHQFRHVENAGIDYIATGISMGSDHQFWMYVRNEKLNEVLQGYKGYQKQD